MPTQKAVKEARARLKPVVTAARAKLKAEMRLFVRSQDGLTETDRIDNAAVRIGWSASAVRQALGRQVTPADWLPQGAALARFVHVASVDTRALFGGAQASPDIGTSLLAYIDPRLRADPYTRVAYVRACEAAGAPNPEKLLAIVLAAVASDVTQWKANDETFGALRRLTEGAERSGRVVYGDSRRVAEAVRQAHAPDGKNPLARAFGAINTVHPSPAKRGRRR